jgi:hypothetical protein
MRGIEDRILSMSNRTDGLAGWLIWTFSLGGNMITSGRFASAMRFYWPQSQGWSALRSVLLTCIAPDVHLISHPIGVAFGVEGHRPEHVGHRTTCAQSVRDGSAICLCQPFARPREYVPACSYLQISINDPSPSGNHVPGQPRISRSRLIFESPWALSTCPRKRPRTVPRQRERHARTTCFGSPIPSLGPSSSRPLRAGANLKIRTS